MLVTPRDRVSLICTVSHFRLGKDSRWKRGGWSAEYPYFYAGVSAELECVTRSKQRKPSNTQDAKQRSAQHSTTARSIADLTKPNQTPNAIHPHKRQYNRTSSHTPSRIKSAHTGRTYTGVCSHAPVQQAGDHPVPAHTEP